MAARTLAQTTVGETIGPLTLSVARETLVAYAAASGDQNPIHQDEQVARSVGLPGVIAHGMFTMALVGRAVESWAGPGRVVEIGCKFTKPVVVPDDDEGVVVRVAGTVKSVEDGRAAVTLEVTCGEEKVLGMPKAVLLVDG